jgi:hypothetical protein
LSETTTLEERLSMMWPLAVEAWTLSGRALPVYDRSCLPGRLFRSGELPPTTVPLRNLNEDFDRADVSRLRKT